MTSLASAVGQAVFFNRAYSLTIIPFGQTTGATYGNVGNSNAGLKVTFEIERDLKGTADKAKIAVFNLTSNNRNAIIRGSTVILRAGYQGRISLLFTGFVRKVATEQSGPDISTSMECGDGEPSITYGAVNRSYTEAVTLARVLQDIATDLNLTIGGNAVDVGVGVVKGIPNQQFPNGLVLEGAVKQTLDKLLKPLKIAWSIQHGKLIILPSTGTLYVSATVISSTSGMTGTPGFTEKFMTFQCLLNPSIVPGALIQMVSKNTKVNGYYRVLKVKSQGDSHGSPWGMDCEAEALKEPLPVLPAAQGTNIQAAVLP